MSRVTWLGGVVNSHRHAIIANYTAAQAAVVCLGGHRLHIGRICTSTQSRVHSHLFARAGAHAPSFSDG